LANGRILPSVAIRRGAFARAFLLWLYFGP
jgi:hypothetical protein